MQSKKYKKIHKYVEKFSMKTLNKISKQFPKSIRWLIKNNLQGIIPIDQIKTTIVFKILLSRRNQIQSTTVTKFQKWFASNFLDNVWPT